MSREQRFAELLFKYPRIAVLGGPKSGKTTLCRAVKDRTVFHSDDFKIYRPGVIPQRDNDGFDSMFLDKSPEAWSRASQQIMEEVNAHLGPCVVEGVRVPHALRKGMKVDCVICLDGNFVPLSPGQKAMAKGVWTVFAGIQNELGVPVHRLST